MTDLRTEVGSKLKGWDSRLSREGAADEIIALVNKRWEDKAVEYYMDGKPYPLERLLRYFNPNRFCPMSKER